MDKENATEKPPPEPEDALGSLLQEWLEPLSEEDREARLKVIEEKGSKKVPIKDFLYSAVRRLVERYKEYDPNFKISDDLIEALIIEWNAHSLIPPYLFKHVEEMDDIHRISLSTAHWQSKRVSDDCEDHHDGGISSIEVIQSMLVHHPFCTGWTDDKRTQHKGLLHILREWREGLSQIKHEDPIEFYMVTEWDGDLGKESMEKMKSHFREIGFSGYEEKTLRARLKEFVKSKKERNCLAKV
jgi:hypothetical protein